MNRLTLPAVCILAAVTMAGCWPKRVKTIEPTDERTAQPVSKDNAKPESSAETNPEPTSKTVVVVIETSKGTITAELYADKAPQTVANFLRYVREDFYAGTVFHRVIPGFMIQCGGFTSDMRQKATHEDIPNEADNGLENRRGTLAMARTSDPHSASSQFFINLKDNDFLNFREANRAGYGYCVFGKVIDGMDVVDAIAAVDTASKAGHDDVPVEPVLIQSMAVKE